HQAGIIHRDVKPANVMLTTKGGVKIVDFGVAKLAGVTMTRGGSSPGTLAYMAPEQIRGEPVTPATDLWALGAVFYEMMTGSRPFRGEYEQAVAYTILNEPPAPLDQTLPKRPPLLDSVVTKALSKDSKARYQTAEAFIEGLETVTGVRAAVAARPARTARPFTLLAAVFAVLIASAALLYFWKGRAPVTGGEVRPASSVSSAAPASAVATPLSAVAVLPFTSISGAEDEYLAEGMQEAVIVELGRIEQLRVVSRTSASAFRKTDKSATEIAKALGVDELVEGSVQRTGDRVRVQLKLVRTVPEEKQIWAETYDRQLSDVFALYGELAAAVASRVDPRLAGNPNVATAKPVRRVNPEIYRLYLKGKFQIQKGTEEDFKRGIAYLREASEIDPSDALPYAGIAIAYALFAHSPAGSSEVLGIGEAAARKAVSLDPELAEGHAALALLKQYNSWDWKGLEQDFLKALELNPTDAELRRHYAWFLMCHKRGDEALVQMRRSRQDDPMGGIFYSDTGWILYILGRDDEALIEARRGVELDPENVNNLMVLGLVCLRKGMPDEAIEHHRKVMKLDPNGKWMLAYSLGITGRKAEAQKLIDAMLRGQDAESAFGLGWAYIARGDRDEALRWLEISRQRHAVWVPWVGVDPEFASLRGDPRFTAILTKIGVPDVEPGFGVPKT
ncbi:MAG: tetratricopeptide repeat-containing serine/threonine-protein kinase, partial [Thermoanaerobaculia bacterium]|nr:tetratricopeptide repeat-containing serine/threonine-protein kinase [Thermoanaerobaculia bacterium]